MNKNNILYEQIQKLGWGNELWGAEGVYLDKDKKYRLQIISQSEQMPSVHNLNNKIDGLQNLHIFIIDSFATLFYGYCDTIEEFKSICKHLRIDSVKPEEAEDE